MAFEVTNQARQNRIRRLADRLKSMDAGDIITHQQIAKIVGISPCPSEMLHAAITLANREAGTYFESQRGIGYIRRPPTEWEVEAIRRHERARRQEAKGRKTISNIVKHTNELSDDEQRRASRAIGLMQTIEALTRRSPSPE